MFVRELTGERKASSPVGITVNLRDVNDNPPILESIKDVTLSAGNTRRTIAKLNATDNDSKKQLRFSILHVSNNGLRKFAIKPRSGELEVVAPVKNGERFSITVQAMDSGGMTSQAIMEVIPT